MEQLSIQVPYSFIRQMTRLTWKEVKYGIEEGMLRPQAQTEIFIWDFRGPRASAAAPR